MNRRTRVVLGVRWLLFGVVFFGLCLAAVAFFVGRGWLPADLSGVAHAVAALVSISLATVLWWRNYRRVKATTRKFERDYLLQVYIAAGFAANTVKRGCEMLIKGELGEVQLRRELKTLNVALIDMQKIDLEYVHRTTARHFTLILECVKNAIEALSAVGTMDCEHRRLSDLAEKVARHQDDFQVAAMARFGP